MQLKPYVAYKSSGGNIMTLLENSTVFGPSLVEIAQGRINVNHDASYFNPTMILRENNGSDYARLHFVNDGEAKRYEIAANPGNSDDRLHIAYDDNPILTVHGTSGTYGKIGINYSLPSYALQLPNSSLSGAGKALANEWRTYSDARVKSDVESLASAIPLIKELNPVTYFQHDSETMNGKLNIKKEVGGRSIGFLAQELYDILPEAVNKPDNENTELWSVGYSKLIPILTRGIQEQQTEIEAQRDEINTLKSKLSDTEVILAKVIKLEEKIELLSKKR